MTDALIRFIREQYRISGPIPLHAPVFRGNEKEYLAACIDSTFVSSVGEYVNRFEHGIAAYTKSPSAVATMNGTAALHMALKLAGVTSGDLVITQPLTFVATCNAIAYLSAAPLFIDVDRATLGLSPTALSEWLDAYAQIGDDGLCRTISDRQVIRACVPMHSFGHPCDLDALVAVCSKWHIALVEDAAESLGSLYKGRHTGTFGMLGVLSFNGNKIITTGGGGMILSNSTIGAHAKHLTTTAKTPHPYRYMHDEIGYNYRLPNLNAALGCAQLVQIEDFITAKRTLAEQYEAHLKGSELQFVREPAHCRSNYWLNTVICENAAARDALLQATHAQGIGARPVWEPMTTLPMYEACKKGDLKNAEWLAERIVNLPSSVPA